MVYPVILIKVTPNNDASNKRHGIKKTTITIYTSDKRHRISQHNDIF